MKHHIHCASGKTHHGVCRDSQGEALPTITEPNLSGLADQPFLDTATEPRSSHFGYSATGLPVHAIMSVPRPLNFGLDPDGHPANFQTEQYFRHVGSLKPIVKNDEIESITLKGDKDDWRPEGPRIEVAYSDETGVKIEMEMTITEEMKPYCDADMALKALTSKLGALAGDVNHVRRLYEQADK